MALSTLPLSYCTNVHPAQTLSQVEIILDRYTQSVKDISCGPLAAGLWLSRTVINELLGGGDLVRRFKTRIKECGISCHTLNAFPYGNFHQHRVKDTVYLPDWASSDRLSYTVDCATALSDLLPPDGVGSISTLPLGFKGFLHGSNFLSQCAQNLVLCAQTLSKLKDTTGRTVRLAIEPEPFCSLETTRETIGFFQFLWQVAESCGSSESVREHIGLCFDICHQAVEFEDVAASVRALTDAGVRINKVHISCAIQLDRPADNPEGVAALRSYVEPRYLHQTFGRFADGRIVRAVDLNEDLLSDPAFLTADEWRVHFHVPVDADRLGPLQTTRPALTEALTAIAGLDYAPHLEVETYTWDVLPGAERPPLVEGLAKEIRAARTILSEIAAQPGPLL